MEDIHGFTRQITVIPAYDKRPQKPGDPNYGVHGARLIFVLTGEEGAVDLEIQTGWHLPHVAAEWAKNLKTTAPPTYQAPYGANLGYHSRVPRMSGEGESYAPCGYLGEDQYCYSASSGVNAREYFDVLVAQGSEGVWERLEAYYWRIMQTALTTQICVLCDQERPIADGASMVPATGAARPRWVCTGCRSQLLGFPRRAGG